MAENHSRPAGWVPNPPPTVDPTILTTQAAREQAEQLRREMQSLDDVLRALITGNRQEYETRYATIAQQFVDIERRRVEYKADALHDVEVALSSMKEAVAKSEASVKESLIELRGRIERNEVDTRLRFERVEGLIRTESRPGQDLSSIRTAMRSDITTVAVVLGVVVSIVIYLLSRT